MIKPVYATSLHDPANGKYGNCMSACFASILNIPIECIPNFDDPTIFDDQQRDIAQRVFLRNRGFALIGVGLAPERYASFDYFLNFIKHCSAAVPCIVSGATRQNVNHAVIVQGGKIVMNPSRCAIIKPTNIGAYHAEWTVQIQPHWSQDDTIRFYH